MSYRPITDFWVLARPKVQYHGAYPAGFVERARALLGCTIFDRVLHVCAGKVREYPYLTRAVGPNDGTIDMDEACRPDYVLDVRELGADNGDLYPDPRHPRKVVKLGKKTARPSYSYLPGGPNILPLWDGALIDRPYTEEDAAQYSSGADVLPEPGDLLKRTMACVRPGGRVGMLDYVLPRPPKRVGDDEVKFVACIAVLVGFGNRIRVYSVFERVAARPDLRGDPCGHPEAEALCFRCGHKWMEHDCNTWKCARCDCQRFDDGSERERAEAEMPPVEVIGEDAGGAVHARYVETPAQPSTSTNCPNCEGGGYDERAGDSCAVCDGWGTLTAEEASRVEAPPERPAETPSEPVAGNLCRRCWLEANLPEPPNDTPLENAKCDKCDNRTVVVHTSLARALSGSVRPETDVDPALDGF